MGPGEYEQRSLPGGGGRVGAPGLSVWPLRLPGTHRSEGGCWVIARAPGPWHVSFNLLGQGHVKMVVPSLLLGLAAGFLVLKCPPRCPSAEEGEGVVTNVKCRRRGCMARMVWIRLGAGQELDWGGGAGTLPGSASFQSKCISPAVTSMRWW